MPTYEYRCPKGHEFEHFFRSIKSAEGPMKCPTCGEVAERRISGGTGLLFKGSGFYITDYRSESYKKAAAADTGKSEGGKSDTAKPDTPSSKPSTGGSSSAE